ncbi:hypothetical protein TcCL_NonESM05637 [Trypanosoma cruzi]|nr:hypothetical protein TcCL_NonESM05637 [Trypanosoma cruzi]
MLSATETWRQCAAMMDNTSKEELLSAAAVAGEKLAADEPTRCTFSDGPQETSNAMLVNALLFFLGSYAPSTYETQTRRVSFFCRRNSALPRRPQTSLWKCG